MDQIKISGNVPARISLIELYQVTIKVLLQNKLDKAGDVILCDNKAKNVDIAIAIARLFNEVSAQKNKPEWSSYFVTMPKGTSVKKDMGE